MEQPMRTVAALLMAASTTLSAQALVTAEFIFESAPFPSVHASTIAETSGGLVAAWFGGTREGASDVGIWVSRRVNGTWTPPVEVATGAQPDGTRHPTWNPVLFELRTGELTLFYKVGPSPRAWWGMTRTSRDNGRTWSDARRLPNGFLGPVKNKPVRLPDGTIIEGVEVFRRLYASVGFERIGIRPAYYQAENGREDAVILTATLQASR